MGFGNSTRKTASKTVKATWQKLFIKKIYENLYIKNKIINATYYLLPAVTSWQSNIRLCLKDNAFFAP